MASYITLNVGGKLYQTKRSTLERYQGSFFPRLLEGDDPDIRNKEGHYLIDRDGETFRYVLNFLRCGRLVLPDGFQEYELLKCEADFFELEQLKRAIQEQTRWTIGLSVGGKHYQTKRSTLERYQGSFFPRLLQGNAPSTKNEEGHFLIDRDGEIFRYVLNFLRCGRLVLPDGFQEYELLKCEAEFFELEELKKAIQEQTRGAIGLRVGGKTFRMTTEEGLREQGSFLAKVMSGKIALPRDSLGNFVVDRDASMFRLVLRYLQDGGIFISIPSGALDLLKKEGEYFGLEMLVHHTESVQFMQRPITDAPSTPILNLHLFYHANDQSVIYANHSKRSSGMFKEWHISDICSRHYVFSSNRFAGLLDVKKVTEGRPAKIGDITTFIRDKMGGSQLQVSGIQLKDGWTKVQFST